MNEPVRKQALIGISNKTKRLLKISRQSFQCKMFWQPWDSIHTKIGMQEVTS
jgi:hypothetical protein